MEKQQFVARVLKIWRLSGAEKIDSGREFQSSKTINETKGVEEGSIIDL